MSSPPPASAIKTFLILGGARSGKSARAEDLVLESGLSCVHVATAEAHDDEMRRRITAHQSRRSVDWGLIEEPLKLPEVIAREAGPTRAVMVDCLTLWLANLTFAGIDIEAATRQLSTALIEARGPVVLVSNEVGLGIVPETRLGRSFRDDQGRLNQRIVDVVDAVEFVAAGRPIQLKPRQTPPLTLGSLRSPQ